MRKFISSPVPCRFFRQRRSWWRLASSPVLGMILVIQSLPVLAAPPAVTSLSPGGLARGTEATLQLIGKPGTLPLSVWSSSADFVDLKVSEKGDQLTLGVRAEARPGLHWLRFYNSEGATSLLPLIVGVLPESTESEPNNAIREAGKIETLPHLINGVLHKAGEVDTFEVALESGETLVACLDAYESLGSPMDAILQILNEAGFVVAQNDDDHGFDPLLTYAAAEKGKYFVRVFCFPAVPNSTINFAGGADYLYRLTLTNGPFLVSAPLSKLAMAGWNLSTDQPLIDQPQILPGLHSLYTPALENDPLPELEASQAVHPVPLTVSGVISAAGEVDQFSIATKAGDSYRIRILAREMASHLDPVLSIRKSDGSLVKESDDLSREELDVNETWKSPADGNYILEVTDRYQHGGFRYGYLLNVRQDSPKVELTVGADQFLIPKDKPLEIPVTINRLAGFDKEVAITTIQLPAGVTADVVKSEPTGDSAKKVTLKLSSNATTEFQGSFQILATYDASPQAVPASAALKTMKKTTHDLWLTVPISTAKSN